MKIISYTSILIFLLLSIVLGLTYYMEPKIMGDELIAQLPHDAVHQEQILDRKIRWIETGTAGAGTIVFFHGAPGSWADFSSYLMDSTLKSSAHMISVDRPGYGQSGYGDIASSIQEQTDIYHQIIEQRAADRPLTLVGYSYGGPVAAHYAAVHPERISELILLAPVIAPEGEKIFWFNPILHWPIMHWLQPKYISAANDEKLAHAKQLQSIDQELHQLNVPTIHMHCTDDWIAPYKTNVDYVESIVPTGQLLHVSWEGDSHFLPNNIKQRLLPTLSDAVDRMQE